jgi:hypothetical protein
LLSSVNRYRELRENTADFTYAFGEFAPPLVTHLLLHAQFLYNNVGVAKKDISVLSITLRQHTNEPKLLQKRNSFPSPANGRIPRSIGERVLIPDLDESFIPYTTPEIHINTRGIKTATIKFID